MKFILPAVLYFTSFYVLSQNNINWLAPVTVATNNFDNLHPRVVIDASGNPLVLWGNSNTDKAVFTRWNGSAFTAPVNLNPAAIPIFAASWAGPDIASKGDTVYAVFKKIPESAAANHIYIVRSFNNGVSFSAPVQVDFIGTDISRFPTVTIDNSGNPIVAFMKFNSSFGNARWVVAKSNDYGMTFSPDVLASGYSGGTVCDCCPGSIIHSGNFIAMMYRDNLSNIRDMWAGISTDDGNSFPNGIGIDQTNWNLNYCPSSSPDGVIVGDTLYSVFMSGATGKELVYTNKNSISTLTSSSGNLITGDFSGLLTQNYPRIASAGNAVAIVWKQNVNGTDQLALRFTNNISTTPFSSYTVAVNNIKNTDIALTNGTIHVVWEDVNSGTVHYRKGTFTSATSTTLTSDNSLFKIYPNPCSSDMSVMIQKKNIRNILFTVHNIFGEEVYKIEENNPTTIYEKTIDFSKFQRGIYFIDVIIDGERTTNKIVKQ